MLGDPVIRIVATSSPGEVRVAVADGDMLLDYAIGRPGTPDGVGDLHRGRILSVVPAMAGAFVALDGADGFLPDSEGAAGQTEGTVLGVRITRAAQGGKGPRLTARLDAAEQALAGPGPVALLRRGPGPVERLARLYPDAPVLADDAGLAAELRPALGTRVGVTHAILDETLAEQIEALERPEAALPGGARMSVHPTPALVAIDIDAGAATAERRGKAASQAALNRRLLPALARQIRLRNLSGAILVDLAGMPARKRAALGPALAAALADDPLHPRFFGFTALGLAEILRPRVHPPLHELLAGPHAAGLAALRFLARAAAADPALVPVLRAAPAVVAALQADPLALNDFARRTGRKADLRNDPGLPATRWRMETEHRA
jgi:Ribonuclease G/E